MAKINYLNNRELLKEIHRSKMSYCSVIDEMYDMFDVIIFDLSEINNTLIKQTLQDKADRLTKDRKYAAKESKSSDLIIPVDVTELKVEELVFRVMTEEHIPIDKEKTVKSKTNEGKITKTNFPAFKHYVIDSYRINRLGNFKDIVTKEVGRSHWKGGLHNGEFCLEHGAINNRLAIMFMKLVERYAQRGNWRGYCVTDDVEALTQRGWLTEDQITEDDIILSYEKGKLKWSKIKSIYRGEFDGLMHYLTQMNIDSLITPNHKLVTERGLIPVEYILGSDNVILMGDAVETTFDKKYSDAFVELIGWIITEGRYQPKKGDIHIHQDFGIYADKIRNCLRHLNFKVVESVRNNKICFSLRRKDSKKILKIFPEKNLTMNFILDLTDDQRELLINTMIDGAGYRIKGHKSEGRYYDQKCKKQIDLFQALCTISGYRTDNYQRKMKPYNKENSFIMNRLSFLSKKKHIARGSLINFHGGLVKNKGVRLQNKHKYLNVPTTYYKGTVWCPETEYGSFIARRNGKVYLTGNTYNEEMRGHALLQLSQVGLKFNEAKSSNPFSYYTETINNSFTRVLNMEKKSQNIRDDLLIANNASPSFAKQYEHEIEMKNIDALDKDVEIIVKSGRGRKKKVPSK